MTISYVDLYQSTLKRQTSLLGDKCFLCTCSRCQDPLEGGRKVPISSQSIVTVWMC
jgi:hypothetical protein